MPITDEHYEHFKEHGYTIIENLLPEDRREEIAEALRRCLPPWEEIKHDPGESRSAAQGFPYPDLVLNRFFVEPDLVSLVRRLLGTDDIQYRPGFSIVRYPGEKLGTNQGWHIDNGNNSLLPESEDWNYGQVVVWYFPEGVGEDQGPIRLVPKPYENDTAHEVVLAVPPGTAALFHNYVWHSGTDYMGEDGQRYSHAGMYGRSDFPWEGLTHFTSAGQNTHFRELVSTLSTAERQLFRFPPPGHPYYTEQTLKRLEDQYPGWNANGDYS
jgi:hypothetical protein